MDSGSDTNSESPTTLPISDIACETTRSDAGALPNVVSSVDSTENMQQTNSIQEQQQSSRSPSEEARGRSEASTSTIAENMQRAPTPLTGRPKIPAVTEAEDVDMTGLGHEREISTVDDAMVFPQGSPVHNVRASDATDVVDLTRYDDEDDTTVPVKSEPQDSQQTDKLISHLPVESVSNDDSHRLPAVGDTNIPDDIDEMPAMMGNSSNEMSSDSMAELLIQFNQNNEDSLFSPPEIDSDEEDIQARKRFQKVKNAFRMRQRAGNATAADEIDFKRHEKEEDGRLRARKNRKQHEHDEAARITEDDCLFVPQESRSSSPKQDDDKILVTSAYASLLQSEQGVQEEATTKKPRRGRPAKANGPDSNGNKKAADLGISKKLLSGSTAGKSRKKKNEPAIINTNNLLYHDIIAAAKANEGQAEQPSFTSKNKKNALNELISSLPTHERNLFAGDKADLEKASKNFNGRGSMKADGDGNWRLKGMKTSLRHYQMLGVSWMRKRENDGSLPKGGILSDDMGLGKTVSAITNMVDGRPTSSQRGAQATLIVMPPTLMVQWMSEIEKHVEPHIFRNVAVYKAKHKILDPVYTLGTHDIIITSYQEVARSLPSNNPPPNLCTEQARLDWWHKELEEKKGPLHRIHWHRIILDESQAIKNHLSKTSEAVCQLMGRYRWCLSGTPIQNSLEVSFESTTVC